MEKSDVVILIHSVFRIISNYIHFSFLYQTCDLLYITQDCYICEHDSVQISIICTYQDNDDDDEKWSMDRLVTLQFLSMKIMRV